MARDLVDDIGFIKPEIYFRLRDAMASDVTPILVVGRGGSGKSTLLELLQADWIADDRPSCFVNLDQISREDDLILSVRTLLLQEEAVDLGETSVVASSGRRALDSLVRQINHMPRTPLILLDGLDEVTGNADVLRFVRLISDQTDARIVVSSRLASGNPEAQRLFRGIFQVPPLSKAEIEALLSRHASVAEHAPLDEILDVSGGLPLFVELMGQQVASGDTWNSFLSALGRRWEVKDHSLTLTLAQQLRNLAPDPAMQRALAVLAILDRPMTVAEMSSLGLVDPGQLPSNVIRIDAGKISFVHRAIGESVLREFGIYPKPGTRLGDLKFGAEEAERDVLFRKKYIDLPGFDALSSTEKSIVIGDRGTGKSAMFAQLESRESTNSPGEPDHVVPIGYPADLLKKFETNGEELRTADQFRAGWLTLIAHALAGAVPAKLSRSDRKIAARLAELVGDPPPPAGMVGRMFRRARTAFRRSSIKLKLGPVAIEPAGANSDSRSSMVELSSFIERVSVAASGSGKNVIIAIDRLDEIHKYDRELQERAVQGLFLAEGYLAQYKPVKLIIFLRSDLFRTYDIQEKNKLISRSAEISWSKSDLVRFLVDRVLSNASLQGLADFIDCIPGDATDVALKAIFPAEIEGLGAEEWLWEWLENGNGAVSPRQLVLLLLRAVQAPGFVTTPVTSFPIFPAGALRWAMDKLSELSFNELIDDFRVAPTFLSNCKAGRIDTIDLATMGALFSAEEGAAAKQIDVLERLGFLERVVVEAADGQHKSQLQVPALFTRGWTIALESGGGLARG